MYRHCMTVRKRHGFPATKKTAVTLHVPQLIVSPNMCKVQVQVQERSHIPAHNYNGERGLPGSEKCCFSIASPD